jgi:membrane fusion protein
VVVQQELLAAWDKEISPLSVELGLEADVVQDKRKVWEWVLDPVLATTTRMKNLSEVPSLPRPGG